MYHAHLLKFHFAQRKNETEVERIIIVETKTKQLKNINLPQKNWVLILLILLSGKNFSAVVSEYLKASYKNE